jgi:ATP-dependent RNA helicase RhlE
MQRQSQGYASSNQRYGDQQSAPYRPRFGGNGGGFGGGRAARPSRFGGGGGRQGGFGGGGRRFAQNTRKQVSFDPSMFVKKVVLEEAPTETFIPQHQFADFDLTEQLTKNIISRGYTTPTQIQDQAIPHLLEGRDVVGLANTGTGKTAAFLIPLINKVFLDRTQKVLIVVPTRELATQIDQEFRQFAAQMSLYSAVCIGGVNIYSQIYKLQRKPHFVIGTPGRLRDLESQGVINFSHYNNIVLDEVDQMLDMGFIHDVKYISAVLPTPRQSLFFSATLPTNAQHIMREFLHDPIKISVKSRDTAANIEQDVVRIEGRAKIDVLHEMLQKDEFEKVLVFLRTKHSAEKLTHALDMRRISVAAIHGNKTQNQRQRAIEQFKSSRVQVLIATDVASRGLDIDDVTHVINFDLPETMDDYIHRIGRTGRANKKGIALTFV